MCGIFCAISRDGPLLPNKTLDQRLRARGPDSYRALTTNWPPNPGPGSEAEDQCLHVTLCSTVLSLRGQATVEQPYGDPDQDQFTLCWNGEAWRIQDECTTGNDTRAMYSLLVDAVRLASNSDAVDSVESTAGRIADALATVEGPYAFVFYDHTHGRLFFGRDFLGRRSLMYRVTAENQLVLSSVSDGDRGSEWREVQAHGIHHVDLRSWNCAISRGESVSEHLGLTPYRFATTDSLGGGVTSVIPRLSLIKDIPSHHVFLDENSSSVASLHSHLRNSLSMRVLGIPDPPVKTTVSASGHVISRLGVLFSGGLDCTALARISHDILPFSEPVDLLNVAFENPRIHKSSPSDNPAQSAFYESCPDRITGRASHAELQENCPEREWRFIAINVPYTETLEHRAEIISLMHPHNTEMDLSIACALYFAARGSGVTSTSATTTLPEGERMSTATTARVLLSGLGADELFGGYTRHATAFRHHGFEGLMSELELDVSRLGQRNLGRDDRVLSHWAREVRFPFLDERLLTWALAVPVSEKCGFGVDTETELDNVGENASAASLEPGKKVLRCLAWKLGMQNVAREKKRAIQFGARTAKMETGRTKGTTFVT